MINGNLAIHLNIHKMEKLVIAGREFNSRLFLGTGKFNSNEVMEQSILASGTEMVTDRKSVV